MNRIRWGSALRADVRAMLPVWSLITFLLLAVGALAWWANHYFISLRLHRQLVAIADSDIRVHMLDLAASGGREVTSFLDFVTFGTVFTIFFILLSGHLCSIVVTHVSYRLFLPRDPWVFEFLEARRQLVQHEKRLLLVTISLCTVVTVTFLYLSWGGPWTNDDAVMFVRWLGIGLAVTIPPISHVVERRSGIYRLLQHDHWSVGRRLRIALVKSISVLTVLAKLVIWTSLFGTVLVPATSDRIEVFKQRVDKSVADFVVALRRSDVAEERIQSLVSRVNRSALRGGITGTELRGRAHRLLREVGLIMALLLALVLLFDVYFTLMAGEVRAIAVYAAGLCIGGYAVGVGFEFFARKLAVEVTSGRWVFLGVVSGLVLVEVLERLLQAVYQPKRRCEACGSLSAMSGQFCVHCGGAFRIGSEARFCASRYVRRVHRAGCPFVDRIARKNLVEFKDVNAARSAGYVDTCSICGEVSD